MTSRLRRGVMAVLLMVGAAAAVAPAAGAQTYTQAPHSGSWYAATSTQTRGGGAYEDVALSTSAGQLVCGSAWLRTQYPATGASGTFAVWLIGGSAAESGSSSYSGLSNLGNWSQVHACVEATGSHTTLRVQFYPTIGSPAVGLDDVDVHESLAVNGGFENGSGPWAPYPGTGSNYVVYAPAPGANNGAYDGGHFAATNTSSGGGGIYEDVSVNTSAGQLVCGSAELRTEGAATGASGAFALWLLGGSGSEGASTNYSGLGNYGNWSRVQTCVEATGSHTSLRVQFYPTAGAPTVEIDDVDVHESLAVNGGFENGPGPWAPYPGTRSNYVDYAASSAAPARNGSHFGATNTAAGGGGIYEDVSFNSSPGQLVCGSAWLRTEGAATGASGTFALWLIGGSAPDGGSVPYSGLGNGGAWTQVQPCVEATGSHTTLRVQFYPTPGSPTVEIDDVDVHPSLAANGGFEDGAAPWAPYPGTASPFGVYPSQQVTVPAAPAPPPVVPTPTATPLPRPKGRHALRVAIVLSWTWQYATTQLRVAQIGRMPHDTKMAVRCSGRGCPRPLKQHASGPRRIRRLLARMTGRRYRRGDVLWITLTARGYRPERAKIEFRYERVPLARLVR